MAWGSHREFVDPESYQSAIHPAKVDILVTARGAYSAALTRVEFPRVLLQHGRESLARVATTTADKKRPPFVFLADARQAPITQNGRDLAYGEIVVVGLGATRHHRTVGACDWAGISLTQDELGSASRALLGREVTDRSFTHIVRPSTPPMARLLRLQQVAEQLAQRKNNVLVKLESARALEAGLLHALIMCLADGERIEPSAGGRRHAEIIARFEETLAANYDRPLHLPEICAAIDAPERTLRVSCMEHLGMGPTQFLWLRRMHIARRALIQADKGTASVTEIATASGFWELGRFAVEYRILFGEAPSATLRRPAREIRDARRNPFVLADAEYA
jgi:AraC-like DNA-binding protein